MEQIGLHSNVDGPPKADSKELSDTTFEILERIDKLSPDMLNDNVEKINPSSVDSKELSDTCGINND